MRRLILSLILFITAASTQAMDAKPAPEYRVSLSISGFIAAGAIWPNFEYIIDGRNSVLVEGAYYAFGPSQGDRKSKVRNSCARRTLS